MIRLLQNNFRQEQSSELIESFNESVSNEALSFHKSFPGYGTTPLVKLNGLAAQLEVEKIWIKDESYRFDLNAFKVLGASHAIAKLLKKKFLADNVSLEYSLFKNEKINRLVKNETLITATDGNHGRGVAWAANQLECNCIVYMPKSTTRARVENIRSLGAEVIIVDGDYDHASRIARKTALEKNFILVQDSSWDGYEEIPLWIMHGYLTIIREAFEQMQEEKPTHIFIQCGVGSLPAAVLAYLINRFGKERPTFCVVEPESAACVYESFLAGDGNIHSLKNEINTVMAGLACGTPSKLAWEILRDHSDYFITCGDETTVEGMKLLHRQTFGDHAITSGESGAVTIGLIFQLLSDERNNGLAEQLKLNSYSKILLISTEGDTDPETYRKILSQQ